ncbi:MAG TPA: tetratricopeptide repeat protein [Thermoanaerobaculia bacterium]|nr:tetratricopeptide repeat protein [Thermoanaerobaculia bacterium]
MLALTPEMRAWAHAQVPASLPPIDRLDLLVKRLQASDGAALHYDAWFNATAAEAFAARRFNCLAFSHLMVAMARELGLEAYYLEARNRERYGREGDLVLLAGHVTVGWGAGVQRWAVEFGQEARLDNVHVVKIADQRALALHYTNLGAEALRQGDPTSALAALATAVEVDPSAGPAWVNLGVTLRRRGDSIGAEAAYRRAMATEPNLLPPYANLYALLRVSGRAKESAALLAEIAQRPNRDPWLLLAMGDECLAARDYAGAERLFRRARSLASDEAAPAAALAALALARGDLKAAGKWARRAAAIDPHEPRLVPLRGPLGMPPAPPAAAVARPAPSPGPSPVLIPPTPN